jgi:hypothetical protein
MPLLGVIVAAIKHGRTAALRPVPPGRRRLLAAPASQEDIMTAATSTSAI